MAWAAMFLMGLRHEEPERLVESAFHLDAPIPFVLWEKRMHKARRRMPVALAPEMAELLRRHVLELRAWRATPDADRARRRHEAKRQGRPHLPAFDERMFPVLPSRVTWRAYRDELGIPPEDGMGLKFAPHSARKWFGTELTIGRHEDLMVKWLLRHKGDVTSKYSMPPLDAQATALSGLPRLWPGWTDHLDRENAGYALTSPADYADTLPATSMRNPSRQLDPSPSASGAASSKWYSGAASEADAAGSLSFPGQNFRVFWASPSGFQSSVMGSRMPRGGLITVDSTVVGEVLEALGRLLRSGASHGSDRQP